MGRGRAKAKQTKVARQLKYTTTGTDLDRLRAELTTGGDPLGFPSTAPVSDSDDDEDADEDAAPEWDADDEDDDD
jgi:hypothetical protein